MSRSRRKPVVKDKPRNEKSGAKYWRTVRRVTNEKVKYLNEALDDETLPIPKEIVNDYDYSDYNIDYRFNKDEEMSKKESRK
jgi:hypothetical protein